MRFLILAVALTLASCATLRARDPFSNPDGSVNVPKILAAASYGLAADCAIPGAVTATICSIGTPAVQAAQAAADHNPQAAATAAGHALDAFLTTLPADAQTQARWYFQFAVLLLNGVHP